MRWSHVAPITVLISNAGWVGVRQDVTPMQEIMVESETSNRNFNGGKRGDGLR
jgi:hypothetical protein